MSSWQQLAYSSVMVVAVVAAASAYRRTRSRLALSAQQRLGIGLAAFAGAMLGAKLPFLGQLGWAGFLNGSVWFADGKTILGGIFGGYLAVELAKPALGIRTKTGDAFALPIASAVMIGRFGCFVAGCCFGTATKMPWGMHFERSGDVIGLLRHPTQLYEVAFHFVAILCLWAAEQHRWFEGHRLKVYLLGYLVYRFLTEWIRPEAAIGFGLTSYQWACLGLSLLLIVLWLRDRADLQFEVR